MNFQKMKVAELRKLAEEQKIEGWEEMNRKELIAILKEPKEEKPEDIEVAGEKEEEPKEEKTPIGIEEGYAPVGSKAEAMKAHLAKQPKVRILIPLGSKEKMGSTTPVTLNGYRLNIQKGVYVDVPEQVAEIIMTSQKQTLAALNEGLNLDNPNHPKRMSGEGVKDLE